MGQLSLSRNPQNTFETGSWVEAIEDADNTMFTNINPYRNRLLMNKETSELVEEYQLQFISQKDLDSFLAQLQLRKETNQQYNSNVVLNRIDAEFRNSPYIYKIKYFQNLSVKELCSTIFHGKLYISKVEVRLKELNDIPFYDEIYLYYACLSGFKILHQKVGVFQINEEMIFFDQEGQVKVWMNPNLSSFTPNYEPQDYNNEPVQNQGSQSQMLKNLMNIIEENTDKQSVGNHVQFRQYLIQKGLFQRLSFSKAIEYFESYCEQNKLPVNNCMTSIYELFHQDEHHKRCVSQSSEVNKIFYNTHFELGKTNNEALTNSKANNHYSNSSPYGVQSQIQKRAPQIRQRAFRSTNITPVNQQQTVISFNAVQPNSHISNFQNELSKIKYYQNGSSTLSYAQPKIIQPFQSYERKHKTQFTYQTTSYLSPSLKNIPQLRHRSNRKPQGDTKITFCYKPPTNVQKSKFAQSKNQFTTIPRSVYPPRKESIIDKLQTVVVQKEVLKENEAIKILSKNSIEQRTRLSKDNSFNFYSTNKEYALDKEIADDMIKYLGFNPNI